MRIVLRRRDRIHARQRLVEDEQFRIVDERLRHLDALAHALAVGADLLVRRRRSGRPSSSARAAIAAASVSATPFRRTSAVTHSRPVIRS